MKLEQFKKTTQKERDAYARVLVVGYKYDEKGNLIRRKSEYENKAWWEWTYDDNGKELTYISWNGYWKEKTYKPDGAQLTFEDSTGYYEINYEEVSKAKFDKFIRDNKKKEKEIDLGGLF